MRTSHHEERGETLVEVLIAIIVIGIVVAAFFSAIAASSTASKAAKDFVNADLVLRNYAESAKQAVRTTCTSSNTGAAVTVPYTAPSNTGITVSAAPALTCPSPTTVQALTVTATLPSGTQKTLSIDVRTP